MIFPGSEKYEINELRKRMSLSHGSELALHWGACSAAPTRTQPSPSHCVAPALEKRARFTFLVHPWPSGEKEISGRFSREQAPFPHHPHPRSHHHHTHTYGAQRGRNLSTCPGLGLSVHMSEPARTGRHGGRLVKTSRFKIKKIKN